MSDKDQSNNDASTDRVVELATTTLYAALGAADFLVARATEQYETALKEAQARREKREAKAAEMRRRVIGLPETARTLPEQAKTLPDQAKTQLDQWLTEAGELYDVLAQRGKVAYGRVRGQAEDLTSDLATKAGEQVQDVAEQLQDAADQVEDAAQQVAETAAAEEPAAPTTRTTTTPRARKTSTGRASRTPGAGPAPTSTTAVPDASDFSAADGQTTPSDAVPAKKAAKRAPAKKAAAKKSPAGPTTAKKAPSAKAATAGPAASGAAETGSGPSTAAGTGSGTGSGAGTGPGAVADNAGSADRPGPDEGVPGTAS